MFRYTGLHRIRCPAVYTWSVASFVKFIVKLCACFQPHVSGPRNNNFHQKYRLSFYRRITITFVSKIGDILQVQISWSNKLHCLSVLESGRPGVLDRSHCTDYGHELKAKLALLKAVGNQSAALEGAKACSAHVGSSCDESAAKSFGRETLNGSEGCLSIRDIRAIAEAGHGSRRAAIADDGGRATAESCTA